MSSLVLPGNRSKYMEGDRAGEVKLGGMGEYGPPDDNEGDLGTDLERGWMDKRLMDGSIPS